jgi:hypothetical protein
MSDLLLTARLLSPAASAVQRLASTRARLGAALGQDARHSKHGVPVVGGPVARLATQGVIGLLAERWRQSPWRVLLQVADQAADTLLRPSAQTHPVGLVLAAGAAGGLVVLARPWRWLPATSLLALWPLARRAVTQAALHHAGEAPAHVESAAPTRAA